MIEVAAGVIVDTQGRVLLQRRLPGQHLAGLWEFPGGKLEPGEDARAALVRELTEEIGIVVEAAEPLIVVPWDYPGKSVRLNVFRVIRWRGVPNPREGNPLRWVAPVKLDPKEMPAADGAIVDALRSPCVGRDVGRG